jgi:hypothetical protein
MFRQQNCLGQGLGFLDSSVKLHQQTSLLQQAGRCTSTCMDSMQGSHHVPSECHAPAVDRCFVDFVFALLGEGPTSGKIREVVLSSNQPDRPHHEIAYSLSASCSLPCHTAIIIVSKEVCCAFRDAILSILLYFLRYPRRDKLTHLSSSHVHRCDTIILRASHPLQPWLSLVRTQTYAIAC